MWPYKVVTALKTAWRAPIVPTKALLSAIFVQLARILVLDQTNAHCVVLAISPPLRVLLNV